MARWARPARTMTCAPAAVATTMLNTEDVAVSLSVHQLLHFSAMRATTQATISTVLDDDLQEFPTSQLEDELV
jgi:hypothetical protein